MLWITENNGCNRFKIWLNRLMSLRWRMFKGFVMVNKIAIAIQSLKYFSIWQKHLTAKVTSQFGNASQSGEYKKNE